jgi:hypothetical protein
LGNAQQWIEWLKKCGEAMNEGNKIWLKPNFFQNDRKSEFRRLSSEAWTTKRGRHKITSQREKDFVK